jgi:outer membrane lipoprotein SlyB
MAVSTVALSAGAVKGQIAGNRFAGAMTDENALQQGLQVSEGNLRDRSVGVCGHLKLPYWI